MHKMLVIGFSAGGFPLIKRILQALPKDYPLPIAIVAHLPCGHESLLDVLLGGLTQLPVSMAKDKEAIIAGRIYLAPPDYHLLVEKKQCATPSFALSVNRRVKLVRPSIDVLFESAAEVFESGLIAVLLSGANADGAEGMTYVKQLDGLCIVLDPRESEFSAMPNAAIQQMNADYIASMDEIISLLLSVQVAS
jgi:two-component system chemotaxis response regulator CheB